MDPEGLFGEGPERKRTTEIAEDQGLVQLSQRILRD